jgi:hypothetical protein
MTDEPDPETDAADRARKCGEDVTAITLAYMRRAETDAERISVITAAAAAALALLADQQKNPSGLVQ